MQSSWWAEFLATRGWEQFGAAIVDGGEIVGGARVLIYPFAPGKCFYYIPEGPLLPRDETDAARSFRAIVAFVDRQVRRDSRAVSHLRLEPRWASRPGFARGCREAESWIEPRSTLQLDLRLTEPELLAQMKPKGRYNIGVARRHGVSVVEDRSPRGIEEFLAIYRETYGRHGLSRKRASYFRGLFATLPADCTPLLFAEYRGTRVATALLIRFGERATYFMGGSRSVHRKTMASYLLQFESMRRAKALGHRWYDFYGVAPQDRPDHPWAKFSDFKRKFGGVELSFVPALDYIYDPLAYVEYHRPKTG